MATTMINLTARGNESDTLEHTGTNARNMHRQHTRVVKAWSRKNPDVVILIRTTNGKSLRATTVKDGMVNHIKGKGLTIR